MWKGENNYCTFSIKEFIKNLCVFLYSFLLFGFFTILLSYIFVWYVNCFLLYICKTDED